MPLMACRSAAVRAPASHKAAQRGPNACVARQRASCPLRVQEAGDPQGIETAAPNAERNANPQQPQSGGGKPFSHRHARRQQDRA